MIFEIKNYEALEKVMKQLCDFLEESDISSDDVFDSKLVLSELVSNILQHSNGFATVNMKLDDSFIELKVHSSVYYCPPEHSCCSDVMSERGRGLYIVDSICTDRDFTEDGCIKVRIKINKN